MKTYKAIILVLLLFSTAANAQITKGNWMVGGTGSYSQSKSNQNGSTNVLNVSPNVGYFVFNKLSIGTLFNYYLATSKYQGTEGRTETTDLGPFIRYYILDKEKRTNLFLDASYNFSLNKENSNTVFASKIGISLFLNSSVAFETSLKYSRSNYKYNNILIPESHSDGLTIGLGLQIHLEK